MVVVRRQRASGAAEARCRELVCETAERCEGEQGGVGDRSGEGPPGPIPNPEVKLTSADGTARATAWESTPLPTLSVSSISLMTLSCNTHT